MELIIRCRVFFLIFMSTLAISLAPADKAMAGETATTAEKTLMIYGDSLSAAYGIELEKGWVALLRSKLRQSYPEWQVVNLSISGETTAGGLSRLPAALAEYSPDLIVLELGANDGLRGTPLKSIRSNLEQMLTLLQQKKIQTILLEMQMPPNYGPVYTKRFNDIYNELGKVYNLTVIPFFLDGVAGHADLNQPDGIHPTAEAQPQLLDNIWPEIQPLLGSSQ